MTFNNIPEGSKPDVTMISICLNLSVNIDFIFVLDWQLVCLVEFDLEACRSTFRTIFFKQNYTIVQDSIFLPCSPGALIDVRSVLWEGKKKFT